LWKPIKIRLLKLQIGGGIWSIRIEYRLLICAPSSSNPNTPIEGEFLPRLSIDQEYLNVLIV